jgi:hypothetical protein
MYFNRKNRRGIYPIGCNIKIRIMKKISIITIALLFSFSFMKAQILTPVKWSFASKRLNPTEAVVFFKATIEDGWHLYSQTVPDGGPVKTSFTYTPSKSFSLAGNTQEPNPTTRFEKVFDMKVAYFENSVIFQQKVKLKKKGPVIVKGSLEFMTCNDEKCIQPQQIPFSITIK